jgi:DNA-binding NarL/FixJ family response regulator
MIKILIADDHPIIRTGLKQIISEENNMKITGEAENAAQLFELIKKNEYDILILDISLPDLSGLEVLSKLKNMKQRIPVLILSALPEEQYAVRVIRAGASGYLNKITATDQLVNAINKIISGGRFISPELSEKLINVIGKDDGKILHQKLSPREFEILRLIASGKTVKDVADKLFLSIPTVYTYRTRILEKMDMKTDSELVQYCIIEGLVL